MPGFRAYDAMAARELCGRLPNIEMLILNTTGTAVAPASSIPPLPDVEAEQAEASAADGDDSAGVTAHYEASDHQGRPHDRGGPAFVRFHAGGGGAERERCLVLGGEAEMGSGERGGKGGCGGSHCGGARGLPGCGLRDGQREDYSAGGEGPRGSKHRRSPCSHVHMLCNSGHLLCNPGHLLPMVCGTAPALLFRVAFYAMAFFLVNATYVFPDLGAGRAPALPLTFRGASLDSRPGRRPKPHADCGLRRLP